MAGKELLDVDAVDQCRAYIPMNDRTVPCGEGCPIVRCLADRGDFRRQAVGVLLPVVDARRVSGHRAAEAASAETTSSGSCAGVSTPGKPAERPTSPHQFKQACDRRSQEPFFDHDGVAGFDRGLRVTVDRQLLAADQTNDLDPPFRAAVSDPPANAMACRNTVIPGRMTYSGGRRT